MSEKRLVIHLFGTTPVETGLRIAMNALNDLPEAVVVHVVVQGPLVAQLGVQVMSQESRTLIRHDPRIEVLACGNSMKSAGMRPDDLMDEIQLVPSAIGYIASRQWDGWAYARY